MQKPITLTSIHMLGETYTVKQASRDASHVYCVEKTKTGRFDLLKFFRSKIKWHDSIEDALEACRSIPTGALALRLMSLGLTVYGINLQNPLQENPTTFDIYEFSGL